MGARERRLALYRALSCETRWVLLEALRHGERTGSELIRDLHVTKTNLSQHLRILREGGLVRCVKDGSFRRYSLTSRTLLNELSVIERKLP